MIQAEAGQIVQLATVLEFGGKVALGADRDPVVVFSVGGRHRHLNLVDVVDR